MAYNEEFMTRAVQLSISNIDQMGGPFGAVIVKDGLIVAEGCNGVTRLLDPTAHAEMVAIRSACQNLKSFSLEGCEIYTSCEPCPMCLSAIYWARIDRIYYANSKEDAAQIDFDDQFIYEEFAKAYADRQIPILKVHSKMALKAFEKWSSSQTKTKY